MKKELIVDGRTLALSANAATPVRYKMAFGEDLLKALSATEDATTDLPDVVSKLAYVMNKQATQETTDLSFDNYLTWLEDFDDPNFFLLEASEIIQFYLSNVKTGSKAKNSKGPKTAK